MSDNNHAQTTAAQNLWSKYRGYAAVVALCAASAIGGIYGKPVIESMSKSQPSAGAVDVASKPAAADGNSAIPETYKMVLLTENFPPFNFSKNGDGYKTFSTEDGINGIATETMREVFKRAGINYEMTLRYPWSRIYDQTLKFKNTGLFSTTRTESREKLFKWVGPVGSVSVKIFVKGDSPLVDIKSPSDLQGVVLGTYKGDVADQELTKAGFAPNNNALDDSVNVIRLIEGRIDAWGTTDPVGPYFAKARGLTGLRTIYSMPENQVYLALNLDTPDSVVQALQKALDDVKYDGTYEKIQAKYL